jgi:F-type H+-transporting ATPase subunit epsilon
MAKTMQLEVLTPDEIILNTDVEAIRVQLADGWWGILPRHAPFLAYIIAGIMLYRQQGETRYVALYQGTIEVQRRSAESDRVLVLTAAAEAGEDLAMMEQALERQRARLKKVAQEAHIEFTRARMALERALRETAELAPLGSPFI